MTSNAYAGLHERTNKMKQPPRRWLNSKTVRNRYDIGSTTTLWRWVEAGRLPPPEYPCGENAPRWCADALDSHEAQSRASCTWEPK
jgi:hypothetical protein